MKKVLVLAAAIALFAGQAWALSSVVGSKHDMTQTAGYIGPTTEVCVFCHTPHGAATNNPNAPLWNRSYNVGSISNTYNSATVDAATKAATVAPFINNSDAPLCLTCHDGAASVKSSLLNVPNSGAAALAAAYAYTSAAACITTDLTNDHPIGMDYATIVTNDAVGFNTLGNATANGAVFYGGRMWCSSCHDVHDDSYAPFLVTDNAASALCLVCHNK